MSAEDGEVEAAERALDGLFHTGGPLPKAEALRAAVKRLVKAHVYQALAEERDVIRSVQGGEADVAPHPGPELATGSYWPTEPGPPRSADS